MPDQASAPEARPAAPGASRSAPWLILAAGLAVLCGLGGYVSAVEYRRIGAVEHDRLLTQARVIAVNTQRQLQAVTQALDSALVELPEWRAGNWKEANWHLAALSAAMPGVRTLLVTDSAGLILACNRPELIGRSVADREYFQTVRQRGDPGLVHLAPPFQTRLGAFGMNLVKMIPGEGGGFGGVLAATLDSEYFATLLASVLYAGDMLSSIVHGDGQVFLVLPEREGLAGVDLSGPDTQFSRFKNSGKTRDVTTGLVRAVGETRIIAHETLDASGLNLDNQIFLAVSRNAADVYASWRRHLLAQVGVFLALVAASCLLLFVSRRRERTFREREDRAVRALEESERFLRTVTDNIPALVGYWDKDLTCRFANPAYRRWFGRSLEEMQSAGLREVLGEELFRASYPRVRAVLRGEPQHFERVLARADGGQSHTLVHYIPDWDDEGVRGFFALVVDVTELKTAQAQLEKLVGELRELAATDPLTGVGNRRSFFEQAAREVERCKRFGEPLTVLMADIDRFKVINDTHGHVCGDEVLKALAGHTRRMLRDVDLLCRMGGEEFAILLANTGLQGAAVFAERLRRTLEELEVVCAGEPVRFTVSIGAAGVACGRESLEDALRRADAALYVAKNAGRNRVHVLGLGD